MSECAGLLHRHANVFTVTYTMNYGVRDLNVCNTSSSDRWVRNANFVTASLIQTLRLAGST